MFLFPKWSMLKKILTGVLLIVLTGGAILFLKAFFRKNGRNN
jgi:hypothetical protein